MLKVTTIRTCLTTLLLTVSHAGFTLAVAADEVARYVRAMSGADLAHGLRGELQAHGVVVINQSFAVQINDPAAKTNYVSDVQGHGMTEADAWVLTGELPRLSSDVAVGKYQPPVLRPQADYFRC